MVLTRRKWIQLAGGFGVGTGFGKGHSAVPGGPLFLDVPPQASGIHWVHENARSPKRYLPETMGVAFIDFDNDGWMDIFLVNSGPCDFWKPANPVHNALYKNNRDGTFTEEVSKSTDIGKAL